VDGRPNVEEVNMDDDKKEPQPVSEPQQAEPEPDLPNPMVNETRTRDTSGNETTSR
jgi:hypothetical protein